MINGKQLKITKLFRKGATKLPEDCEELQEEIQELERKLKEKQDDLFQLYRNSYRHKLSPTEKKPETFVTPREIVLSNEVESLKSDLDLISMLSGIEVQSFVLEDHCCITYTMQHDSEHLVKHGFRIDLSSGTKEITKSSLPLGFNLNAVMESYDNIMMPECLGAIRRALIAYYDRLNQYEALKKLLNLEAQLFKILDGSHVEVSFVVQNERDVEDEPLDVVLMLKYRVYDIRPKQFSFKEIDLPEGAAEVLKEQCLTFKQKPLRKAFKEAFINGIGPYKLVTQVANKPEEKQSRRHKRHKPNRQYYNNDDTFHPEDCAYDSEAEAE